MEPGVVVMLAVTPSLPFALVGGTEALPCGQFGAAPSPGSLANSLLMAARCLVNTKVVPLLSARTITLMFLSGSDAWGLVFLIASSFHLVILPRKMPVYASRDNFKSLTPSRLYASTIVPAVMGSMTTPFSTFLISASVMAASLAPKSTGPAFRSFLPAPLPTDWYSIVTFLLAAL